VPRPWEQALPLERAGAQRLRGPALASRQALRRRRAWYLALRLLRVPQV
jgi:hypothetical protein